MKDAREAIMALAPEDFRISLSTCFNYTQNFRKGTFQARRHHEGREINACVSLHKAPDTAPLKELVINIHWTSANVNYVLDEAANNPRTYCIDSRDAKQVVRANTGHGGRTWRNIQNPDHTFDTSRTNAVTPMMHLLVETRETKRTINVNKQPQLEELYLSAHSRKDVVVHVKRTGKAITFLNLSHYEPETVFRSINELLYMITLPALDPYFRNPDTGRLKEVLVSVVDNGIEMPRSPLVKMMLVRVRRLLSLERIVQVSFAEYHSKRNPVERVHAVHTKELEKHGPFQVPKLHVDSKEHKTEMNGMRQEVEDVLKAATFGGAYTMVMRGIGGEENYVYDDMDNLQKFLRLNEDKKGKCEMTYDVNKKSQISSDLAEIWGVDVDVAGSYADDYEILQNTLVPLTRTAWTDKYTTVVFNDQREAKQIWRQPLPDYIRWYLTGGEQHYMTLEQRKQLAEGPWDDMEGLFLPSKILNMVALAHPYLSDGTYKDLALLCWCSEEDVKTFLYNKKLEDTKELNNLLHSARWRNHQLHSKSKRQLEEMCREENLDTEDSKSRLVEKLCTKLALEEPPALETFDGDLSQIPTTIKELSKLPVHKLKGFLKFYDIPWSGSKDQILLRVLALRTGTTDILFRRERDGLVEVMRVAEDLIHAQKELNVISNEFVVRQRAFPTPVVASLSADRPREAAGAPAMNQNQRVLVPPNTILDNLEKIFHGLKEEIQLLMTQKKHDPYNLEAIRKYNAKVMVRWTEEDKSRGWTPGWYNATCKRYTRESDSIQVEYSSEPGSLYAVKVKESVENGTLRLQRITCNVADLYEEVTEIGAGILIRWNKEELKESGWRPGWYAAEVQAFDPDSDQIHSL